MSALAIVNFEAGQGYCPAESCADPALPALSMQFYQDLGEAHELRSFVPLSAIEEREFLATYGQSVERLLHEILAGSRRISKRDLFSRMRGAFPAVVQSHLSTMNWDLLESTSVEDSAVSRMYRPELHPLDFEWYFTPDCASHLAQLLAIRHGEILCLGTPTIAAALAGRSIRPHLIDSNAAVLQRFPDLGTSASVQVHDVATASIIAGAADLSIFDPPWYLDDTLQWMIAAARSTKPQGVIAFSLFPSLTRPGAEEERQTVLTLASMIGKVEVIGDVLVYQTPLFEQEALRSCGIRDVGNWRRGDLVVIEVQRQLLKHLPIPVSRPQWSTFFLAEQVVKLRRHRISSPGRALLSAIEGCLGFVYPTVSARDNRQNRIDLWTSRNRVARVGDFEVVTEILQELQNGSNLSDAVRRALPDCPSPGATLSLEADLTGQSLPIFRRV